MRAGYVPRFSRIERLLHWVNALGFFFLLATGLILYLPPPLDARLAAADRPEHPLLGRRRLAGRARRCHRPRRAPRCSRTARELDSFDRDDLRWLRGGKAPQGSFNAGQKINAVLTAAFAILFGVSGLLLWFGEQDTRFRFASTVLLHDGLMYVSLVLLVGHLYLALIHPATRHALRGMTLGRSTRDGRGASRKWADGSSTPRRRSRAE